MPVNGRSSNKLIMKTRKRNQHGYTLIEIIIVIIVLGIIGGITFHVLAAGMETYLVARERQALYNEARLALERQQVISTYHIANIRKVALGAQVADVQCRLLQSSLNACHL